MGAGSSASAPVANRPNQPYQPDRPYRPYPPYRPYYWRRRGRRNTIEDVEEDTEPEVDPPEEIGDLRFENIDMMKKENRMQHQTNEYDNPSLIIRRGQPFNFKIKLTDDFKENIDTIVLFFSTRKKARIANGTRVKVSSGGKSEWKIEVESGSKEVTLKVTPDARAAVGTYSLMVETRRKKSEEDIQRHKKKVEDQIIILFNPFCKDDDVYIENSKERTEYVFEEKGYIFTNLRYKQGRVWNYGQFEPEVLECALYLLEVCYLSKQPRTYGNIVQVLRALSAQVNSSDKNGILTGNWTGDYAGGTSPTAWNGSPKIIAEFMAKKEEVKYGQCWVFAALLTTICRTLGIPIRPVTNFSSAHDADGSCTIDTLIDENGDHIDGSDSVWNFHVWNEVWCKRPDLSKQFSESGWQAIDATPQERSEYMFRCGPACIKAIRGGHVELVHDAPFVFSEVNADKVYWGLTADWDLEVKSVVKDAVGKALFTKAVGIPVTSRKDLLINDVTNQYKPSEGSASEREAVLRVVRNAVSRDNLELENWEDLYKVKDRLDIHLRGRMDENEDCKVQLKVENKADGPREFRISLTASAKYQDGAIGEILAEYKEDLAVEFGGENRVSWTLKAEDYFSKMDDDAWIFIWAKAVEKGGSQIMTRSLTLECPKPEIEIKVDKEKIKVGETFEVTIAFTNPTAVKLTECQIDLEGPGINRSSDVKISKILNPKASLEKKITLTARLPGERAFVASFDCRQIQGINGVKEITVIE